MQINSMSLSGDLLEEVPQLIHRLDDVIEDDYLSAYQRRIILDMTILVSGALTEKYRIVKEVEVEE